MNKKYQHHHANLNKQFVNKNKPNNTKPWKKPKPIKLKKNNPELWQQVYGKNYKEENTTTFFKKWVTNLVNMIINQK